MPLRRFLGPFLLGALTMLLLVVLVVWAVPRWLPRGGLVIRIGLPGWAKHLGDADVKQLTRNAFALLAHAKPKPTDLG